MHTEIHIRVAGAFQGQQRLVAAPPHQPVVRQPLAAIQRVEIQPAFAVVGAQPQFRLLVTAFVELQGVHRLGGNVRHRQQQVHHPGAVLRAAVAAKQQAHVVAFHVVNALDGLADEGLHVGGVLADGRQQGVGGQPLRAFQRRRGAELGAVLGDRRRLGEARGEHQPVVQVLPPVGTARRPGDHPVAILPVDVDPVVIGDKALIQGGEAAFQRRHVHTGLDRRIVPRLEADLGVHHPYRVTLALGERHFLDQYLVGNTADPQQQQKSGEQPGVQFHRTHFSALFQYFRHGRSATERKPALAPVDGSSARAAVRRTLLRPADPCLVATF